MPGGACDLGPICYLSYHGVEEIGPSSLERSRKAPLHQSRFGASGATVGAEASELDPMMRYRKLPNQPISGADDCLCIKLNGIRSSAC
jgi:hypothetical protein